MVGVNGRESIRIKKAETMMMTRVQPSIKAGDIIAFSGRGWDSILINLCSYGIPFWSISHVGIIGEHEAKLVLFESTPAQGLSTCDEDRLADYPGRVWHYPLYRRLYAAESDRLNQFLMDHLGIPYDHIGAIRSGGAAWSWFESLLRDEDLSHIFCSELCAASHREIGMIRTDNVSRWNPNRFIRYERREKILAPPWRLK